MYRLLLLNCRVRWKRVRFNYHNASVAYCNAFYFNETEILDLGVMLILFELFISFRVSNEYNKQAQAGKRIYD